MAFRLRLFRLDFVNNDIVSYTFYKKLIHVNALKSGKTTFIKFPTAVMLKW